MNAKTTSTLQLTEGCQQQIKQFLEQSLETPCVIKVIHPKSKPTTSTITILTCGPFLVTLTLQKASLADLLRLSVSLSMLSRQNKKLSSSTVLRQPVSAFQFNTTHKQAQSQRT